MPNREDLLKNYFVVSNDALNELQCKGYLFLNKDLLWQILIYELECSENPTEIIILNLSSSDIVEYATAYIEKYGFPLTEICLEQSIIPSLLLDEISKAQIKSNGEVWTIHKSDKDNWPSNPHAHNYEKQYKLNLSTGELYRNKERVGLVKHKEFIKLREIIFKQIPYIKLPPYEKI